VQIDPPQEAEVVDHGALGDALNNNIEFYNTLNGGVERMQVVRDEDGQLVGIYGIRDGDGVSSVYKVPLYDDMLPRPRETWVFLGEMAEIINRAQDAMSQFVAEMKSIPDTSDSSLYFTKEGGTEIVTLCSDNLHYEYWASVLYSATMPFTMSPLSTGSGGVDC